MTGNNPKSAEIWALVRRQNGVIARRQLLDRGFSRHAIEERLARGRLHQVRRGVYAVGRPSLTREGGWTAAVLSCGDHAALSGGSAGCLWRVHDREGLEIEVTVRCGDHRDNPGIRVRHRALPDTDFTTRKRIRVTTPIRTLIDLSITLANPDLERAVNEADRLDLVDPETLRRALDDYRGVSGVAKLRAVLDRRTFTLTRSKLEQRFLPIARCVGLPMPQTEVYVNGFEVDFYWPDLGLVVETDSLRHHRTPAQQARDRLRDQAHIAAGMTPLRFTHAQVWYEPDYVERILSKVINRLTLGAVPARTARNS